MSIIFNKLKKLGEKSTGVENGLQPFYKTADNVYTFKKIFFSLKGTVLIICLILCIGAVSFLSLSWLKGYLDYSSEKAIVIDQSQQQNLPGTVPGMDDTGLMLPEGGSQVGLKLTSDQQTGQKKLLKKNREFKPPEYFIIPGVKKDKFDHLQPQSYVKEPWIPYQAKSVSGLKSIVSEKKKVQLKSGQGFEKSKKKQPGEAAQSARQKEKARLEKQKKTKRISDILTLSRMLADAVENNDQAGTARLFQRLFEKNESDSTYFLKLKAFKAINEKKYDSARRLLEKVLEQDKEDYEAGINMAIIEIRNNKLEKAQKRLLRLKDKYPSKTMIDELLEQI